MPAGSNADQAEFWNALPGQTWVERQADLDATMASVTTLLLDACQPAEGARVLDVGCGAGASTLAIADAVGPKGQVLGLDISAPLIRRAEERRAEKGIDTITFQLADAQDHPFEGQDFDLVMSRFGVMFFSDPVAAFRNMATGLRRGGRIAFAAWAGPEANPWFSLPQQIAVARLGPVEATPPEAPGPMAFRDIARVCGILQDAGLADCKGEACTTDLHHPGGIEALAGLATHVGPVSRVMREKKGTDEDRAAITAALAKSFDRFRSTDGVRIPATINIFSAMRP